MPGGEVGPIQRGPDGGVQIGIGQNDERILDVYETEPLPADSPFWKHPKVVLTPHNAADTDPDEISKYVVRQMERFEAGETLENVVDPARGY